MKNRGASHDAACVVNADGTLSNAELHEQMTEGVDDSDFRAKTRSWLLAKGVPAEVLTRVFSDRPPLTFSARE
jgi:hypothetical protein